MHLVGDAAYWQDKDGLVDKDDALEAVIGAAEEVGRKFVDPKVYKALRSTDYHSILSKIAQMGPGIRSFTKAQLMPGLTESEKRKLSNFLQKMKKLRVIRPGDV